jgi:MFS-type transporter involved in bile tolerance (Atg22 family)
MIHKSLIIKNICTQTVQFFKLKDTTLSMVGLVSYFSLNLIRGLVLSSAGFYYALIPGCLGGIASIGIRSHFSKIIERHELGKVFSCLAAIEAVTPLMSASFFTTIFNATMDSMPGLSLILVALILIIPFGVVLWIHGCTQMPDISDKPNNNHKNNINNNITDDKNTEMKEITLSDNEDLSDNNMFQSV